jgi:hypothetical protein
MTTAGSDDEGDEVQRAVAKIAMQAGCEHDEALELLKTRSAELAQTMDTTARFVLDGIIRFGT